MARRGRHSALLDGRLLKVLPLPPSGHAGGDQHIERPKTARVKKVDVRKGVVMKKLSSAIPGAAGVGGPVPRNAGRRQSLKRAVVLAAGAFAVAGGLTISPIEPGVASAWNPWDCATPAAQVSSIDYIWFNGGAIDFGGGWDDETPAENAIVCWDQNQKAVQLKGTMYMDETANFKGSVRIVTRVVHTDGSLVNAGSTSTTLSDAEGDDWTSTTREIDLRVHAEANAPGHPVKKVKEVAVYGYTRSAADGSPWVLRKERHVFF